MNDERATPGAVRQPTWAQAAAMALIHLLLAGFALWARRSDNHWLGRNALAAFAAIFAVQAAAAVTRNERIIDATYQRGLVWLEPACTAGLVAGTAMDRRWGLMLAFLAAAAVLTPPRIDERTKTVGRLLFFATWVPYRASGKAQSV